MKLNTSLASCLLLTSLLTASSASEEHHEHHSGHQDEAESHHETVLEFTEHQAHEHGHAHVNISYSDNNLALSFTLPAIDVFGFEHQPHNEQEKSIAQLALEKISLIKNIVTVNPSCRTDTYSTSNTLAASHEDIHSDIQIDANLLCENNEPRLITFSLFETLPSIEELTLEYISDNKQDLRTLTASENAYTAN